MENEKISFRFKLEDRTLVIIDWANVYGWQKSLGWDIDPERLFEYLSSYPQIYDKRFYFGTDSNKQWSLDFKERLIKTGYNVISKEVKYVPVSLEKSHFKEIIKELFNVLDTIKTTNTEIATKLFSIRQKIEIRLTASGKPDIDSDGIVYGEIPPYSQEDKDLYDSTYDLIEELDIELKKLNLSVVDLQKSLSLPVLRRKCDFDVELARDVFNLVNDFNQIILFSGDGDYSALVEDLISKGKKIILVFAQGHKGKEYELIKNGIFQCSVHKLKQDIKNIPTDFSAGRDI